MHPAIAYVVGSLLFGVGAYGVVVGPGPVRRLLAVELLLVAVTVIAVTADSTVRVSVPQTGNAFTFFVIVLGAVQLGIGAAIVWQRHQSTVEHPS